MEVDRTMVKWSDFRIDDIPNPGDTFYVKDTKTTVVALRDDSVTCSGCYFYHIASIACSNLRCTKLIYKPIDEVLNTL